MPPECVAVGCERRRAKDSDRCDVHRWAQWTGREPAWLRRIHDPEGTGATHGIARDETWAKAA